MKIYLDNCMFNRPFDEQTALRVRMETECKLHIQDRIRSRALQLVWSYMLDFENAQNPFAERRQAIAAWQALSFIDVAETGALLSKAQSIAAVGVKPKDALHVACAIQAGADYFLSTDLRLLKKLEPLGEITALNPISFIEVLDP